MHQTARATGITVRVRVFGLFDTPQWHRSRSLRYGEKDTGYGIRIQIPKPRLLIGVGSLPGENS